MIALPYAITSDALGGPNKAPASERIVFGGIGIRKRGGHDLRWLMRQPDVQFVAVCDIMKASRMKIRDHVNSRYGNRDCKMYRDMREFLPALRESSRLQSAIDMGCGPGFFAIAMARMVGQSGHVIAADLQAEMLQKIRGKIQGTELEGRITLHKCDENKIGLSETVDFVLLFYAAHEVPDHEALFAEIAANLKPEGQVLLVEPPFHVSDSDLEEIVSHARKAGLTDTAGPRVLAGKTVVLKKGNAQ